MGWEGRGVLGKEGKRNWQILKYLDQLMNVTHDTISMCVCVLLIKTFRVLVQSLWHFVYFLFVPLVSQYIVHQLLLYCNFKSSIKIYHTCLACSFCDEYIWHNIVHITYTCLVVWASECPDVKNYKWWLNPVWHRMLYVWTHMATVGVKGLIIVCQLSTGLLQQATSWGSKSCDLMSFRMSKTFCASFTYQ